nr:helitron helicase-like domain-containing protein [Tanacetum cinerariifolium]
MKGKRKCHDLNEGPKLFDNMFGDENRNGGFRTTSGRQRCRRRFLYNRVGFHQTDFRHHSLNEDWYIPVGNVVSDISGYGDGNVVLDFEDSGVRLLSERRNVENVNNFSRKGPRYSRDYTYECLFRQSGSVNPQEVILLGENGYAQWTIMFNLLITLYELSGIFIGGYSTDGHYGLRCLVACKMLTIWGCQVPEVFTHLPLTILALLFLRIRTALTIVENTQYGTTKVGTRYQRYTGSSLFRDLNCVNNSGENSLGDDSHKGAGIGNSMGCRRIHNTERQRLAQGENSPGDDSHKGVGIGNSMGCRRIHNMERQRLAQGENNPGDDSHKGLGIGNSMGCRRIHNTERQRLAQGKNSSASVGHKFAGIGNSMGYRRRYTTDWQTLPHVP